MKKLFYFPVLAVALTIASCTTKKEAKPTVEPETNFTQFVDPYIGSALFRRDFDRFRIHTHIEHSRKNLCFLMCLCGSKTKNNN